MHDPEIPGFGTTTRNYSISCAPGRDYYRISVKREGLPGEAPYAPPGLASNYLHDEVGPGSVLRVNARRAISPSTRRVTGRLRCSAAASA
ncbi:hypothetical protein HC031_26120 [Planosporangium thailandense]|uniref:FAD-binding FR-type domain-containing protein n=1 Tax=Planosporangium thailandense TaxID=765197 RepID=A0ABX0Y490_9ACTN|nr:hypothetical protein [Planosporangium thailandense]NJC73168.1 hypothetical protein [Planosporangium thailandense]